MGPKRRFFRKKFCRFCAKKMDNFSYKNADALARFVSDRGKILPRRVTGTCGKHQRVVAREIKRARLLAILPYVKS
jgi:small subunit ribosomal protein S18